METKELRLGNYVEQGVVRSIGYNNGLLGISTLRSEIDSFPAYHGEQEINPIPVTEEWLLKLGFEKEEGKLYSFYVDDNLDVSLWSDAYFSNPTIELTCNGRVVCKDIKYIHQLQNLYFALTSQELKLKTNE